MKSNFLILLVISLFSLTFFACATRSIPEPNIPSQQAQSTLDDIHHNFPDNMRLTAKIDYVDEINAKRVVGQDLILSIQTPQNMRITISAFDKAISTLVSDGKGFSLIDISQNVYVTGLATPQNISQILPVFLSAADLFRVIYGMYPTDGLTHNALQTQSFSWDEKNGGYKRSLQMNNGQVQNVFYAWPSGDIFKITVTQDDKTIYTFEAQNFKDYKENDKSYRYPELILFQLPLQKTDVRLRIENRDFNVDFSPAVFRLLPPAGAQIITLDPIQPNPTAPVQTDTPLPPQQPAPSASSDDENSNAQTSDSPLAELPQTTDDTQILNPTPSTETTPASNNP